MSTIVFDPEAAYGPTKTASCAGFAATPLVLPTNRAEDRQAVEMWHLNVDQSHVRTERLDLLERRLATGGLADERECRPALDHPRQAVAIQRMVLRHVHGSARLSCARGPSHSLRRRRNPSGRPPRGIPGRAM
jgi:hypothetical protein